jgi:predicted MFS family arabinose efflux permease
MENVSAASPRPFSLSESTATVLLGSIPQLSVFVMPFMLGSLVEQYHMPASVMSWAITVELIFGSLGGLAATFLIGKLSPKVTTLFAVLAMIVGQFGTIAAPGIAALFVFRALLGLGEGLSVGFSSGVIAKASQAQKLFSLQGVVSVLMSLIVFAGLPVMQEHSGPQAVFVALGALYVLLLPAPFFVPNDRLQISRSAERARFDGDSLKLMLIALLASSASNGAWLYFEQIPSALHLSLESITHISLVTTVLALFAPWMAYRVLSRISGMRPLVGFLIVQAVAAILFAGGLGVAWFVLGALLLNMGIIFVQVYLLGIGSDQDPTGRTSSALGGILNYAGVICGTAISSVVVGADDNFVRFGIFTGAVFLLATAICATYRVKSKPTPVTQ